MDTSKIDKLYDNLSYFDKYGESIILFLLVNIVFIYLCLYFQIMKNSEEIKSNWNENRCNPKIIPFAGLINRPENKTIAEYTKENWDYCIQNTITSLTGTLTQPITFITSEIQSVYSGLSENVNSIRTMISSIRTKMSDIIENILERVLNILTPLQQIMIAFKDSMLKMQGILTAGLYTSLGTYYALKSVLGAIVEFIVAILVILVILIVGMWITPATWGMAISMSAVYASIAIPLAVIVVFMTNVLNVQSSGIPKLRCFLEYPECDDAIGKVVLNGNGLDIYNLNDTYVSGSHLIKNGEKWQRVSECLDAKLVMKNYMGMVYCPITKSKVVKINGTIYSDWDEIEINVGEIGYNSDVLVLMMDKSLKRIDEIKIGDLLYKKNEVYGLVKFVSGKKHLLTNGDKFYLENGKEVNEYNKDIEEIVKKWK
uniref:Vint domain-containing protein n=1 Tax=viral metagenome TaxID=1070528 RepID=A0A6C0H6C9_9ZZZZ